MRLSIIDIGTQSLKHYIFEQNGGGKKLLHYKRHSEANLGDSDVLSTETITRNIEILKQCIELNKSYETTKLHLIGTEALRKAKNTSDFTAAVKEVSGEDIEIISQDKEAQYLYEGFIDVVPSNLTFAAINIGGGSTELVIGNNQKLIDSVKIPFGAKFIRKTFGEHDTIDWKKLDTYLAQEIAVPKVSANDLFITGVLDISTTMKDNIAFIYEPCGFIDHPIMLTLENYVAYIEKLRATPLQTIQKYYPKNPTFCEGYTVGLTVYLDCAKKLGVQNIIPSNNDLTDGVLYEMGKNH